MTLQTFNSIALVFGYIAIACVICLVLAIVYVFVDEACRSYRQIRRIERITLGKGNRAPWKKFMNSWRAEYLRSYTDLIVCGFRLPYNVRRPITRDWPG